MLLPVGETYWAKLITVSAINARCRRVFRFNVALTNGIVLGVIITVGAIKLLSDLRTIFDPMELGQGASSHRGSGHKPLSLQLLYFHMNTEKRIPI